MAVQTKYVTTELVPTNCSRCGLVFGMPDGFEIARRRDGETCYCPAGHYLHYTNRETLKQELAGVRDDLAAQREETARARSDAEGARRSHTATKGHLTRTKRRANAGVCLDCHRSFANVRRHRERVHPEGGE